MEEYKKYLIGNICQLSDTTIEEVSECIKDSPKFIINRNEEGKIHSRYLGDRYEPAIIKQGIMYTLCYYLFDGDIKDCTHPFRVTYYSGEIIAVRYYSSERIKNGEPICTNDDGSFYNQYRSMKILSEYKSKHVCEQNSLEGFTLLCDEMEEPFVFKFAD